RFRNGENRPVDLDPSVVAGNWSARPALLGLVVAGEVRADRRPGLAGIGGFEEDVGAVVYDIWLGGRGRNRGGPLKAILQILAAVTGPVFRVRRDIAWLTR